MNPAEFAHLAAAEERMWWFRGMRRILFDALDPIARARRIECVLEGGCGTGANARALARRYGWRIVPVDLSATGLAHARQLGVERLTRASIDALPFPDACFDMALSLDVLPHFEPGTEEAALREFARVVRPGGVLLLRAAALGILRSRHSAFVRERQRFTRGKLVSGVEQCGFRVRRATYMNTLLLAVALLKFRIWEPLTRAQPASGVGVPPRWLNTALEWPLRAEAALLRGGVNLPVGQSLLVIAQRL